MNIISLTFKPTAFSYGGKKIMRYLLLVFLYLSLPILVVAQPSESLFNCEKYNQNSDKFEQCQRREIACQTLIDNTPLKSSFSPSNTFVITGNERAYFHAFPSEMCRNENTFVIPGDQLGFVGFTTQAPTNDETSYVLLSYNGVSGWIDTRQVEAIPESCDYINKYTIEKLNSQKDRLLHTYLVNSKKASIYAAPRVHCQDNQRYLIEHDRVKSVYPEPINGFYFVSYTHPTTGAHAFGWLQTQELTPAPGAISHSDQPVLPPDIVVLDFYDNNLLPFDYSSHHNYESDFITPELLDKISNSITCDYGDEGEFSVEQKAICDIERECDQRGCNWDGTWIPGGANYYTKSQDVLDSWVENRKAKVLSINKQNAIVDLILGGDKPYPLHLIVRLINTDGKWMINQIDEVKTK
ncbi:DUF3828 domain-containing protein [Providencia alcalifaciens]|uniref:DUF3828 domain-containing protein n=1 Tax=Providencia alcalifaciens TaxID=126385 RepID=UPI0015EC9C66|nr:DUF3828 domain-containing protein [Providencia alcalifaciens]EJF7711027.1 DUF3828 domain-containing protein [Providencia rettgeri]QLQ97086.1 DUF3828 domain-containing protein [Providencia alcalifaciens]